MPARETETERQTNQERVNLETPTWSTYPEVEPPHQITIVFPGAELLDTDFVKRCTRGGTRVTGGVKCRDSLGRVEGDQQKVGQGAMLGGRRTRKFKREITGKTGG